MSEERDYRAGLDSLQEDMANHQRRYTGEVTTRANEKLAVETIERLEKMHADERPAPPPSHTPAPPPFETEKTIEDRTYTFKNEADTPMFRTASQFEHDVMRHAMPRIQLLLSKMDSGPLGSPSWNQRTLAAMYFKAKSVEAGHAGKTDLAEIYERAFQLDLAELLEESNKAFGDWRKDEPTKLIIT